MKGAVILEYLIVIAVMAILVLIVSSGFTSFRESAHLNEADIIISSMLRDAQSRTLSSEKNIQYGVHFEGAQVVLFAGNSYNSSASSNEPNVLPTLTRISSINLGGPVDVVFTRLTGAASASGTITIESISNSSKLRIITILSSGNIE